MIYKNEYKNSGVATATATATTTTTTTTEEKSDAQRRKVHSLAHVFSTPHSFTSVLRSFSAVSEPRMCFAKKFPPTRAQVPITRRRPL
jgi:hypothetical protein